MSQYTKSPVCGLNVIEERELGTLIYCRVGKVLICYFMYSVMFSFKSLLTSGLVGPVGGVTHRCQSLDHPLD